MPLVEIQKRSFAVRELRAVASGEKRTIVGHAAVYDQPSDPIGGWFTEIVRPGAFADTLRTADVRCLFNHDANFVLGRTKSGTLRLRDGAKGLEIECDIPDTQVGNDVYASIQRADIDQMSFSFMTRSDRWTFGAADALPVRELLLLDLVDVAPVTFPAYPQTDVGTRSMDALKAECERARKLFTAASQINLRRSRIRLAEVEAGVTGTARAS